MLVPRKNATSEVDISLFIIFHNKNETDLYRPINVNNFKYKNPENMFNIYQFSYWLLHKNYIIYTYKQ